MHEEIFFKEEIYVAVFGCGVAPSEDLVSTWWQCCISLMNAPPTGSRYITVIIADVSILSQHIVL